LSGVAIISTVYARSSLSYTPNAGVQVSCGTIKPPRTRDCSMQLTQVIGHGTRDWHIW